MHTDAELFDRWQSGDAVAGENLFSRYVDTLRRFFYLKVAGNHEDLVQETLLACLESRHLFERRSSFRAFLLGVAKFQLYAHYRASKRDQTRIDVDDVIIADMSPLPSVHTANRADERMLLEALQRMPLGLQLLLELWYWEEMTAPELATVFDIPTDTVYSRMRRARELLALNYKRLHDSAPSPGSDETSLDGWARAVRARLGTLAPRALR